MLLAYLAPERLKGVGLDQRAMHAAPHAYGGGTGPVPYWLEGGTAEGGEGRASVALPACLPAASMHRSSDKSTLRSEMKWYLFGI